MLTENRDTRERVKESREMRGRERGKERDRRTSHRHEEAGGVGRMSLSLPCSSLIVSSEGARVEDEGWSQVLSRCCDCHCHCHHC